MRSYSLAARGRGRAEMILYGDIGASPFGDGVTAKQVAADLKTIGRVEVIDVRINSYGGDAYEGLTIHRILSDAAARIEVHVDGIAASAASVIAMAGAAIHVAEAGTIMIHDAWVGAVGNAEALRTAAERAERLSEKMAALYAARCGRPVAEVREKMRAETHFDAAEAVAFGLATSIARNVRVAAAARPAWFHAPDAPPNLPRPLRDAAERSITLMRSRLPRSTTTSRAAG